MLKLNTDATVEPMTLTEAKAHLRVINTQDDTVITALIIAARQMAERYMGRPLLNQTWELWLDEGPCGVGGTEEWWDGMRDGYIPNLLLTAPSIDLKLPLAQASGLTFKYYDLTNTEYTYDSANYFLDTSNEPSRLVLNVGSALPTGLRAKACVKITFVAGYGATAASVPASIIHAIKIILAHLYDNRGDDLSDVLIPKTALALLEQYQVKRLA